MGAVQQEEGLEQRLVEVSEILQIIEMHLAREATRGGLPLRGLQVLLQTSRQRVDDVAKQLAGQGAAAQAKPDRSAARAENGGNRRPEGRSLASRIQRLPEGEFRTVELDLESESEELLAEEY